MRAAALCWVLAGCLPVYEDSPPVCAPAEIVVHRAPNVADCAPRPQACAQPATCAEGACVFAAFALCGDSSEAVEVCGEDGLLSEVICGM